MTRKTAERASLAAAGVVIVVLTIAAFWLSYAHLAGVARAHGLGGSAARTWAWPATLDMFIVSGELLMLRAGIREERDWCAIGLTVAGSVGSIGLNVAGVGPHSSFLDYLVAAAPPTAALLAFGALMRQIHGLIAGQESAPTVDLSTPTESDAVDPTESDAVDPTESDAVDPTESDAVDPTESDAVDPDRSARPRSTHRRPRSTRRPAAGRPRRSTEELLTEARRIPGDPSQETIRTTLRVGAARAREVHGLLVAERTRPVVSLVK